MRLARRATITLLYMLTLCALVPAQEDIYKDEKGCIIQPPGRREDDPRNIAPTVGTGGPVGGPTGLFTIYDGQVLRKGEYTFSVAYSNFDRDPGDADIVEVPVSFQVGLTNYLELFFNVDAYRGIRVNSPANLSGFYLPNTRLLGNGLCSSPAIIAAPVGNVGTIAGTAVFRPVCSAPFVNYPFFGGNAGDFRQGPGAAGDFFGFPGFNAVIGNPIATGDGSNFGSADLFPGLGSPVGSILPGVVLATNVLPTTLITLPLRVPATFTIEPAYLPDAPFLGREYGETSWSTFVIGGKIRLTETDNRFGLALIPFYRFYADKADDANGFRHLQRGASPGGDIGDFGLVFAVDGRLSRSVNVSANFGYILNSNPKIGDAVILDRPDEFISGVGFDFPINRHFQVITELRTTQYVGGRTPNAFENSPVDVLAGLRVFPKRAWGFGAAYRYHLNNQNRDLFNPRQFNTTVNQITNVFIPGRGIVVIPSTTISATEGAFPRNFNPTDDANGFIFQFWVGNRDKRVESVLPNCPPVVEISTPPPVVQPATCAACELPDLGCTPTSQTVPLTVTASDPDGDTLLYTYSTTGGRITGEGANVTWDLTGVAEGTYTATVEVDDGCGCVTVKSTTVNVSKCKCLPIPPPTVTVSCPSNVEAGQPVTFTAQVSPIDPRVPTTTYNWTVSAGTITSGQGTTSITVDGCNPPANGPITATVEVKVDDCPPVTASCTTTVACVQCRKFDEYGNIAFNDEKARLDNFAIQLQQEPGTTGYIVVFGNCGNQGQARADRAKGYLVNVRGIDEQRIKLLVSPDCLDTLTVELWLCPIGAPNIPTATRPDTHACPSCGRGPRRGPRHRPRRRSRRY